MLPVRQITRSNTPKKKLACGTIRPGLACTGVREGPGPRRRSVERGWSRCCRQVNGHSCRQISLLTICQGQPCCLECAWCGRVVWCACERVRRGEIADGDAISGGGLNRSFVVTGRAEGVGGHARGSDTAGFRLCMSPSGAGSGPCQACSEFQGPRVLSGDCRLCDWYKTPLASAVMMDADAVRLGGCTHLTETGDQRFSAYQSATAWVSRPSGLGGLCGLAGWL